MRARRRNPSAPQLLVAIAATVALTLLAVALLGRKREPEGLPGTLPQPIAPGHGSA